MIQNVLAKQNTLQTYHITGVSYGSGVVGLAKVAIDTRSRSGVDDTAILLLEEVGPSSLGDLVCTAQVHVHDGVPQVVVHVGEGLVTEDTSVVDNDINTAKGVNGALDDGIAILGRSLDTDSLAAELLNLLNDGVGVDEVVDDNGGAVLGKGQRIGTTNTGTGTGNEGNAAGEIELLALVAGAHLHGLLEKAHEVIGARGVLGVGEVNDLVPLLQDGAGGVRVVGLEQETAGSLPSELGNVASTSLEDAAVLGVVGVHQNSDERHNPLGAKSLEDIGGHDSLGHSARSY